MCETVKIGRWVGMAIIGIYCYMFQFLPMNAYSPDKKAYFLELKNCFVNKDIKDVCHMIFMANAIELSSQCKHK